jgi:DNA topoisomerase-3
MAGKRLIIAEKPSVARDIAGVLGKFEKHDTYFENDTDIVASAQGHLLELKEPEAFEVKRGKWTLAHLPVLPDHFDLAPIAKTEAKLKSLLKLIKRRDVDTIVNACDAGREGELIFRNVAAHAGGKKPVQRLWLQSMTRDGIRKAFEQLRASAELDGLGDAARSRAEADWLIGINGTRALTAFNSQGGGFFLTPVGRVQTPTLAMVVRREEAIRAFVSQTYWEVEAEFAARAGSYRGRWFDPGFDAKTATEHQRAERLWDKTRAENIAARCQGQPGTVTEESKLRTEAAPRLFDLTTLQREANGRFGFTATTTLSIAQALYEKHKALTYPRTDSQALPDDYPPTVKETLAALKTTAFAKHAGEILAQDWVKPNKRIFDNSKVSDHFAIIPTPTPPHALSEVEAKLYDLVVKRFLAVFYPDAKIRVTTRITQVGEERFKTEGRILEAAGWKAIYGKEEAAEDDLLVAVAAGEKVKTDDIEVRELATRPPARLTEATLLSAMETAGRRVEDEALREAMRERGLGTPATRASIIEGLVDTEYLLREGKELLPTPKAFQLLHALSGFGIGSLSEPELTGEWESRLKMIEQGRYTRAEFMQQIGAQASDLVARVKAHQDLDPPGDYATLGAACPACGGEVRETYKRYRCSACALDWPKVLASRVLAPDEMDTLLGQGKLGPLTGFRSKMGRPFEAALILGAERKLEFQFDDADRGPAIEPRSLGAHPATGEDITLRHGPYGWYVQQGEPGTRGKLKIKPRRADWPEGNDPETASLEVALKFLSLPRELGPHPKSGKPISANKGRYGPYLSHNAKNISLPEGEDVYAITLERALEVLAMPPMRRQAQSTGQPLGNHPTDGAPVVFHAQGRYGPYVQHGKVYASLPKGAAVAAPSLEQALEMLAAKAEAGATTTVRRRK